MEIERCEGELLETWGKKTKKTKTAALREYECACSRVARNRGTALSLFLLVQYAKGDKKGPF